MVPISGAAASPANQGRVFVERMGKGYRNDLIRYKTTWKNNGERNKHWRDDRMNWKMEINNPFFLIHFLFISALLCF